MIIWKLADILKAHGIKTSLQFQRELENKFGLSLSRQALSKLIENEPHALKLETAQIICNLLDVSLDAFLIITPESAKPKQTGLIQPYKAKRTPKTHTMTNPMDFLLMAWMSVAMQQYFQLLENCLPCLLPENRVKNKHLLINLYQSLQHKKLLTKNDIQHLEILIRIADQAEIPDMQTPKSLIEAENYLARSLPRLQQEQIRFCLQFVFIQLSGHGRTKTKPDEVQRWPSIWRLAFQFSPLEQAVIVGYINWLVEKGFSSSSIYSNVLELRRFYQWMQQADLTDMEAVNNMQLQLYLLNRAESQQPSSKQKILASLKPFLHYYKATINGAYTLPTFTIKTRHSGIISQAAKTEELETLWEAITKRQVSDEVALMLLFILGYGLPLKALPLLRLNDEANSLVYRFRRASRQGVSERIIKLDLEQPWLKILLDAFLTKRGNLKAYPFLFSTERSRHSPKPVSAEHCQRQVQKAIESLLGYPLTINYLERGSIKAMAGTNNLTDFMSQTEAIPLSSRTRLLYWLGRQP